MLFQTVFNGAFRLVQQGIGLDQAVGQVTALCGRQDAGLDLFHAEDGLIRVHLVCLRERIRLAGKEIIQKGSIPLGKKNLLFCGLLRLVLRGQVGGRIFQNKLAGRVPRGGIVWGYRLPEQGSGRKFGKLLAGNGTVGKNAIQGAVILLTCKKLWACTVYIDNSFLIG